MSECVEMYVCMYCVCTAYVCMDVWMYCIVCICMYVIADDPSFTCSPSWTMQGEVGGCAARCGGGDSDSS